MIHVIIVEDEQLAASKLENLLSESGYEVQVDKKLESIRDTVKYLALNEPDLIFLDIHLGDGNAFELFEKTDVNSPVIFTTAYDQYAIKAFKVNSIDYLLKPVSKDELAAAMNKFSKLEESSSAKELGALIRSLPLKLNFKQHFMVYAGQKILSINHMQIACFYSLEKSQYLLSKQGRSYVVEYSLDQLEKMIDPDIFFRVSRQLIIHRDAIKAIEPMSKSRLKILVSDDIPVETMVSVHRTAAFRKWLDR